MNNKPFIPELHDIGKLIDHENCKYMITHYFNVDELEKDRIQLPQNKTFEGIQKHHISEQEDPRIMKNLDVILLKMADHFASGFSRLDIEDRKRGVEDRKTEEKVREVIKADKRSAYKLWNKGGQINIKDQLISCTKENIEAILDIVAKNDWETLFSKYDELLDIVTEDKMPLFNVISLKTHITLVGKVYRFLKSQVQSFDNGKIKFFGDISRTPTGVQDIEKTVKFKVVFASVTMPKFVARVNDLSFFEILDKQLNKLRQEDRMLFVSPDSFLFICGKEEKIENINFIKEFINLGFRLETKEVISPLSELVKLPQELINNEIDSKNKELEKILQNKEIPEDNKENKKRKFIESYCNFYHIYEPQRPEEIEDLCNVCQQNEAIPYNELTEGEKKLVTKEEDGKQIIESLCKYCLNIRKEYEKSGNLKPFAKWEDETPRPDALWIKLSLDINNLMEALKKNYEEYIGNVLKDNPDLAIRVKNQYEIRYTWVSEFLYEYDKFLKKFYEKVKESHEIIKINRDFFVVKKIENGQIKKIVDIYLELFNTYFYDFVIFKDNPPLKLSAVWIDVKSPLMEIWREINKVIKPISIILKNRSKLEVNVETMSYLNNELNLDSENISSFLHKLTEMYEQSGLKLIPLVEVFNERWKYKNLYKAISEKDLSIVDILNWYKIVEGIKNGV